MRQTRLDDFLQLEEHNKELEKEIKEELRKNKDKDKLLFQQNKMAALGEMLGNISHQWRQPLMEISSLFLPIEAKLHMNIPLDEKEVLESINKLNEITKYMSNTIDDFRDFFASDKEKIEFKLLEQINSTINIINGGIKANNIKLDIFIKKNPTLIGYKNEYSQVLINIVNNAKDILIQRTIENPTIYIKVQKENETISITLEDNAGGIDENILPKIFDPYFTTKHKSQGTGIGLYMTKMIIENNINGKIEVCNTKLGAKFNIMLPLS